MNPEILKGRWNQVKGEIRVRWGRLTDDDVTQIEGITDKLVGKLNSHPGARRTA